MRTFMESIAWQLARSIAILPVQPKITFLLPLLFTLSACAPPAQLVIQTTNPARHADAAQLRQVAVLPFETRDNVDITAEIETALAGVSVQEKPFFTVVERKRISELLKELKRGESGLVDPQTAVQIGKMVGAKGVYMGTVTRADTTNSPYTQTRERCLYTQGYQCVRSQTFIVNCTRRVSVLSFAPKLVDVESGRIIYGREIKGEAADSRCQDSQRPLVSGPELRDRAKRQAIAEFTRDVAPSGSNLRVTILESVEGIKSEAARQKFGQGVAFAKSQRMDRACEIWNELLESEIQYFTLVYNVGLCSEINGDYPNALLLYNRADRMVTEPNKAISDGISRVNRSIANEQKLKDQMGAAPQSEAATPAIAPTVVPAITPTVAQPSTLGRQTAQMSVAEVQKRLLELGYQPGKADGVMGQRTIDALKKFQQDNKLQVTGRMDYDTVEKLRR